MVVDNTRAQRSVSWTSLVTINLASCMRSGRVQRRANVLEKIWMQVFQEAGGTLVPNEKLRNMRIGIDQEGEKMIIYPFFVG